MVKLVKARRSGRGRLQNEAPSVFLHLRGGGIFTLPPTLVSLCLFLVVVPALALDTRSMQWQTPQVNGFVPVGRRSHSSFVFAGKLYIFGGYNRLLNKHFNDINCFDPKTKSWSAVTTRGAKVPCPRRRQCCCLVNDRVFIFGGTSPKKRPVNDMSLHPIYERGHLLRDHSDMYVLDMFPNLKTLAAIKVKQYKLTTSPLPKLLVEEVKMMASEDEEQEEEAAS